MIVNLAASDVLAIHRDLVSEFETSTDPISPTGIRSMHLLESAVGRQAVGIGTRLKYDTASSSAATLAYGICMNHPFFNGNKRTSLVAMLCHLDRNDWTFSEDVSQSHLYNLMLDIAKHALQVKDGDGDQADTEVAALARWIRKRVRRVEHGERVVTFRELTAILISFGFDFDNHSDNSIDLVRTRDTSSWFGLRKAKRRERIMRMAYPGGGQVVGKGLLRDIRLRCELDEKHGCDSRTFYGD